MTSHTIRVWGGKRDVERERRVLTPCPAPYATGEIITDRSRPPTCSRATASGKQSGKEGNRTHQDFRRASTVRRLKKMLNGYFREDQSTTALHSG